MDWSLSAVHATFDGETVLPLGTVEELIATLDEPHKIVAEATLESWDPARREAAVRSIRAAGHELYVYRPVHTARVRKARKMKKSDANDACVIYAIASENLKHVYPLPQVDPEWASRRTALNKEFNLLRQSGGKKQLAAAAALHLGKFRDLPNDRQLCLGNPKAGTWSQTLLAVVAFAAEHCTTREEFERLLGLHGSAYPSLLRAEILTHSYRHAAKRGATWTQYRRELRALYRLLRTHHLEQTTAA